MGNSKVRNLVLSGLFAAFMAVGANISPFLVIGGVPVTLQLLFAILAGGLLGSRWGAFSMLAYMLIGLAGAPVFAQFKGGPASLLSPTFGFIISFIFVAYATGKMVGDRVNVAKKHYFGAGILSIALNYLIGANLMYLAFKFWAAAPTGFSYAVAWSWMAAYLPLDIVVTIVSLGVLARLRKALKRTSTATVDA